MRAIEFNDGWSYRHLGAADEPFVPVTLPHDAMLSEPRTPVAESGINSGWFEGRDYEYVRRFTPGEDLAGRTMILEFEGVYHDAEVWIDGRQVAFRPYGYTDFSVDVSDALTAGREHEIRVIARNADQPNSRWYSGAGIYRPVTLWVAPRDHIKLNGVTVRTLSIGSSGSSGGAPARVQFLVETTAPGTVTVDIAPGEITKELTESRPPRLKRLAWHSRDRGSVRPITSSDAISVEGKASVTLDIPNPRLWSPDEPNLYAARIRYESARTNPDGARDTDETTVTFGIRTLAWGSEGFKISGKRVLIQGACIHHDNGVLGACAYPDAEERKLALLKRAGYNAIRSAHNPCSKALLDAADRLGMLVMDEYIDHWYIHKTRHDYVDHFSQWWRQDLADMVAKDRNHPSVVMYSTGNEVGETAHHRGIAIAGAMTRRLHALDPTRPVTCGINIFFNLLSAIRLGQYSDRKAEREAQRAANLRKAFEQTGRLLPNTVSHHAIGSEFFNQLAGRLGADFMKTMASLPPCDWATRGAFANMDIAGYNYGINRYGHDLRKYPRRIILGTETFCADAYRFREYAKTHPRVIGDFVWAGMDYMGETGIGSWEYEDYAPLRIGYGWLTAGSGRLDLTGRPLGEAYYTRVALEADRGPYIAVQPVNHTDDKHSPSAWKMTNAIRSWSWNGCDGRLAHVEVYARAAAVALFVNGREVGRKTLHGECIARFMCAYRPGVIEAVAYDATGHDIGRDRLHSATDHT
ncbi:glycoside hydrolase family 2 protein, partial [Bifidobacterium sp. 82T10]